MSTNDSNSVDCFQFSDGLYILVLRHAPGQTSNEQCTYIICQFNVQPIFQLSSNVYPILRGNVGTIKLPSRHYIAIFTCSVNFSLSYVLAKLRAAAGLEVYTLHYSL